MAAIEDRKEPAEQALQAELRDLSARDIQLWLIGMLVLIVVVLGFLSLILPNLLWHAEPLQVETKFLPQLFTGFIVLIILFALYLTQQKRRLDAMRESYLRDLLAAQTVKTNGYVDPLTKLFDRTYVDFALGREIKQANRQRRPVGFVLFDIRNFRSVNSRFGTVAGDHLLLVAAQILKGTFRGSDLVCRYGNDEFLIIMPDTTEEQAELAVRRCNAAVSQWNAQTEFPYKLSLNRGVAAYSVGDDIGEVLERLTTRLNEDKQQGGAETAYGVTSGMMVARPT